MNFSPAYLILMLTDRCNLACRYCYLGSQGENTNRGTDMSCEMIDQALGAAAKESLPFHVQLTGGEPLLVPRLIEYAAQKTRQIRPDVSIGIQSNATLMNDRVVDLIKKYDLNLGISIDGDPCLQEAHRGRAGDTFKGLRLLEKEKVPFNVTTVVTAANADKLHRLVLSLGGFSMARGIGLDPLVLKGNAKKTSVLSAEPDQVAFGIKKMITALDMVNAGRHVPLVIREMEKLKEKIYKTALAPFCHAAAGQSLAVTPEGKLFPCSQTANDPDFALGTLDHPETGKQVLKLKAYRLNRTLQARCRECGLSPVCPGECPSRLHYNKNHTPGLACAIYQALASQTDIGIKIA
ncbi:radical SAM/SPASM domain-containing protein [Desulfobacula toluolica]|uniref:Radical SAM protein, related to anaerobic sulfatase-maturating enzyme n=1 Tax=Desulfobacula toluolica (strain DSM 7467 / Tol2) TaxID=651182 RepID=K0NLA4_DESTT|nr:radical SAM protein [Desulfobacula toluolica]CCK82356.1 radical SAM protein, related to anaerobic sulfatase-maturating enzyme [Desulfobacula toluolica Tol2]